MALLIQSIPYQDMVIGAPLKELFPLDRFDVNRPGITFLSCKDFMAPYVPTQLLHYQHSDLHWTPLVHTLSGKALADLIESEQLLPKP